MATSCFRDLLFPGSTLTLRARNLLDYHYHQAGRYGSVEGWPLSISAELNWQF
jgi:hypothetical protein